MRVGPLRAREALSRLLLVSVGLGAPLAILELAVHVVEARRGPVFPGGMRALAFIRPDPELGWRHAPDFRQRYGWPEHAGGYLTIATNNLGLREDAPTSPEPRPGVRRVLALGDSQTDGLVENDESWPNVTERVGAAASGPWEILNAGVTGYQPPNYLGWWRAFGRELRPELVLLGYYLGNDLATGGDPTVPDAGGGVAPTTAPATPRQRSLPRRAWIAFRHRCRLCALASLVGHRLYLDGPTYEESMFVRGTDDEEQGRYLAAVRRCVGCLWQSLDQRWRVGADAGSYQRHLAETEQVLRALRDEVRAAGATLVVVLIPTKLQVEPAAMGRARQTAALLGIDRLEPLLEDRLEADMRALLDRLEVPAIDARAALEAEHARTGEPVYYDGDWHLDVAGSMVVGETVAAALAAQERS